MNIQKIAHFYMTNSKYSKKQQKMFTNIRFFTLEYFLKYVIIIPVAWSYK